MTTPSIQAAVALGMGALAQSPAPYYVGLGGGQTRGGLDAQRISDSVITPLGGAFTSQTITTVAGNGAFRRSGDGGPAHASVDALEI